MLRIRGARTLLQLAHQPSTHFPSTSHFQRSVHTSNFPLDSLPSASGIDAFTTAEALLFLFSPTQLGTQAFHSLHSVTGLPWWASIPLTTLAARCVLAPLSLKARAASANFSILNTSLAKARVVRSKIMQELQDGHAPAATKTQTPAMWGTTRLIYQYLRMQQKVPPFSWYIMNATAQASVLWSLTSALHYMCASVWPGFVTEGLLYFKDLTAPAVYLQTLSTPCGTMGAVLPLGLVLLYLSSTELTAGAQVPGIIAALRLSAAPLYCTMLLQPHAVLLCWGAAAVSHHALLTALSSPAPAAKLGMPSLLLPPAAQEQQGVASGPSVSSEEQGDVELLIHLGKGYAGRRRNRAHHAAVAASCFRLALQLKPGSEEALAGLAALQEKPEVKGSEGVT